MKQLSKNEKILGGAAASILLIFAFKILILDSLHDKFEIAKEEISRLELFYRKFSELKENKDVLLKGRKDIERYVPSKGISDEEINQKIDAIARAAGINVVDMSSTKSPGAKNAPSIYKAQMRAEAENIEKLAIFIHNLENADLLFKVDKLSLSMKDEGSRVLKVDASIIYIPL